MQAERQKFLIRRGSEDHHGSMTGSGREDDLGYADLPELDDAPAASRLRIPLTRLRAALLVLVGYSALAWGGKLMLAYTEGVRGYDDLRDQQMVLLFGVVMAVLCIKSLYKIYAPSKPIV